MRLSYPSAGRDGFVAPLPADYPRDPGNRILVRVLAPHFDPIEAWFSRSEGRGVVENVPPGDSISVEVDEYDATAADLGTGAPLLGRGWTRGVTLAKGESKTVEVAMRAKGTIVTVCGAPASDGAGTPGDSGDGGLDNAALLGNPSAVKAGPDDAIYVASSRYGKVKRIDRYGIVSHFAGDGSYGIVSDGTAAASAPVGEVSDIDADPSGNIYLFTANNQIVKVAGGVASVVYDNGAPNAAAWFNLAVAGDDLLYFVNAIDPRVFRIHEFIKSDFVRNDLPHQTVEPIDRLHYPISGASGIAYMAADNALVFADTQNDRIMTLRLSDMGIRYLVAEGGGAPFYEGVEPLEMAPVRPRVVECNPFTGNIFFVETGTNKHRVLYIDSLGKVRTFAGTGNPGFSGDGGPAAEAELYGPRAVTVDSRGNAYIADFGNHAVRMVVGGALP